MGRKKRKLPLLENIEVVDIGAEGKSIARIDDRVIFLTNTVPGDIVDVQVNRKRKNFLEGYPVRFHKYSETRIKPFCSHFGVCGGCKWQSLSYSDQLSYKEKQVKDQLTRIGKISKEEAELISPIIGSENIKYYRNKLEYTFSNKKWLSWEELNSGEEFTDRNALGFHIPKMFDKVLDIEECYLQPEPSNKIRNWVRSFSAKAEMSYFDLRNHEGLLRNLIIRTSNTGEVMVIVSFFREERKSRESLLSEILKEFPGITSLMYVINQKANDTILDQEIVLYSGKEFIVEKMEEFEFKVGPKSFYQTNSAQAYKLYQVAREFAGLKGGEIVYDFYTGTGTIALFMSGKAGKVVGIESVPEAIEDAKENARSNSIKNAFFYAGDIKDVFSKDLISKHGSPDVVIMDPPRAGLHSEVIVSLLEIQPPRIVYVSCNPATQARDIQLLSETYSIKKIQPVDMFPQTHHVENVVLLEIK
ncbi:MAG: 23S rRNA (uracil(1939)-C(5))-methyltransferase RlmD [Bacteroidota bacterium]|nr:23S rRNA (uracil(1939)-C(5))-methyltransferase RlmD [Bacteroidota bacterium]